MGWFSGFFLLQSNNPRTSEIFKWQEEARLVVKPEPCSLGARINVLNNKGSQSSQVYLGLTDCYLNSKASLSINCETHLWGDQGSRSRGQGWILKQFSWPQKSVDASQAGTQPSPITPPKTVLHSKASQTFACKDLYILLPCFERLSIKMK